MLALPTHDQKLQLLSSSDFSHWEEKNMIFLQKMPCSYNQNDFYVIGRTA